VLDITKALDPYSVHALRLRLAGETSI